jgi:hypothetical protein
LGEERFGAWVLKILRRGLALGWFGGSWDGNFEELQIAIAGSGRL